MTLMGSKQFFSGFCFRNEVSLFDQYVIHNDFTIAGFSWGAQKAFDYVCNATKRIDRLQLISPAFFQDQDESYKRMQLRFFKKDPMKYRENFFKQCGLHNIADYQMYCDIGSIEQLESLLYYQWCEDKLIWCLQHDIRIELFLGLEDKIINVSNVKAFFQPYATIYSFKNASHLLLHQ